MKISFFGAGLISHIIDSMAKDGHMILYNKFSTDVDVVLIQSHSYIYDIYKKLKLLKKNNIKLVNLVLDIPPWRLEKSFPSNNFMSSIRQCMFNYSQKNQILDNIIFQVLPT